MKDRGWLGLHTSIWKIASTHVVVDGYTNIDAPLLPLLIPHLNLSLATAGTLAMCFQMANSVSQLGFGALADRWRPRLLVMAGPLAAVVILSFVGLATSPLMLGVILVAGGLGGAAFHPPAAALVYRLADHRKGLAMSTHLSGGSLGFSAAPILFAPFIAYMGLRWSPLIMIPGLIALAWTLRQVPVFTLPAAHERSTLATLRPAAVPLTLLYLTIVLRTATTYGFMTFTPTLLTRQAPRAPRTRAQMRLPRQMRASALAAVQQHPRARLQTRRLRRSPPLWQRPCVRAWTRASCLRCAVSHLRSLRAVARL
jgi:FSR family fosmidomycin resistance protein-like MFS transporter